MKHEWKTSSETLQLRYIRQYLTHRKHELLPQACGWMEQHLD